MQFNKKIGHVCHTFFNKSNTTALAVRVEENLPATSAASALFIANA